MRVAAFQRAPILDDPRAVSAAIAQEVAWAASEGAGLAIFPEAYLDGHSYDRETVSARARALPRPRGPAAGTIAAPLPGYVDCRHVRASGERRPQRGAGIARGRNHRCLRQGAPE